MPYGFNEDKSKYDLSGKANAAHEHAAGDITSGALPIARGGTGKSATKAAQHALLSDMNTLDSAPVDSTMFVAAYDAHSDTVGAVHKRPMNKIWDYIAGKIRSVFGFNSSNVLPVANGGTGATTAANARNNLNVVACGNQTDMLASLSPLTANHQLWALWANVINDNNSSYNGKRVGILVNDNGFALYNSTDGGTEWSAYTTKSTIPIVSGGTGQTAVTHVTKVSDIISAASGVSITGAVYSVWGKMVQLNLNVTATAAKSGTWTVGTVVSAKRPCSMAIGSSNLAALEGVQLMADGTLQVTGSLAASGKTNLVLIYMLP